MAHHITQRGNNRQDVFFVDGDRLAYLGLLRDQCGKHGVRVLGCCLMTSHIHLVAIPPREDALNLALGRTHFLHTGMINRLHGRTGYLWQGCFHSCPMDDAYTLATIRYVERNPMRAKMTRVKEVNAKPSQESISHIRWQGEIESVQCRDWVVAA